MDWNMKVDDESIVESSEIRKLIKVWMIATVSICYCYYISSQIPKGINRLVSLLPIISLFIILPLSLSSVHFCGITAFYLVWLSNFKLLLFAFGLGPLSPPNSLIHFLSSSLLPIQFTHIIRQNNNYTVVAALKVVVLVIVVRLYKYRELIPDYVIYVLYSINVYLALVIVLSMSSALVRIVLGLQIDPQFNEPYLATSLQDFWGRRWNLMVPSILRATVYLPTVNYSSQVLNRSCSRALGMFTSFLVSGLMHELIYYYVMRVSPTWEVTGFFVLHGVSTAAEVAAKKAVAGRWEFPVAVSRLLTLGYVIVTSVWLFFPQIVRNGVDLKIIKEYHAAADFVWAKLSNNVSL